MSSRQARRFRDRMQAASQAPDNEEGNASSSSSCSDIITTRPSVFSQLALESEEDDEEQEEQAPASEVPSASARQRTGKNKKQSNNRSSGCRRRKEKEELVLLDGTLEEKKRQEENAGNLTQKSDILPSAEDNNLYSLRMERRFFYPENELRRILGPETLRNDVPSSAAASSGARRPRGGTEASNTSVARRMKLWLIEGEEAWPLCRDGQKMVSEIDENGEMCFSMGTASLELEEVYRACLSARDHESLLDFLSRHPFHVNALLQIVEMYRQRGDNEMAFSLAKRALFALQCGFHPKFSPFILTSIRKRPQVAIRGSEETLAPLLRCVFLYMQGLCNQGCIRAALEIAKLLLAMDITLDRSRALLQIDRLAIRSRCFDFLLHFDRNFLREHPETRCLPVVELEPAFDENNEDSKNYWTLRACLPSYAFAIAIALRKKTTNQVFKIQQITLDTLNDDPDGCCCASAELIKGLIRFPSFLSKLLQKIGVKVTHKYPSTTYPNTSWNDLLFLPFMHARRCHSTFGNLHETLVECYVESCYDMWQGTEMESWLHSCTSRLAELYSQNATPLELLRANWSKSSFSLDFNKYQDVKPAEFLKEGSLPPTHFLRVQATAAMSAVIDSRTVSLNSNPLVVFMQTLLPWNQIERNGLAADPIFLQDVLAQLRRALGIMDNPEPPPPPAE